MGNKSKVVLSVLLAGVIVGGLGAVTKGFQEWNPTNWFSKGNQDDIVTDIKTNGILIKGLSTSKQTDGTFKTTFTYSVSPSNATDQSVTLGVAYTDGTDCSSVLTASVNGETKTVTAITDGGGFDQQVAITLTSNANAEATATVTLDFAKRVKSITALDSLFFVGTAQGTIITSLTKVADFALENFVDVEYTKYTVNREITSAFDTASVLSFDRIGMQMEGELTESGLYSDVVSVLSGALLDEVKSCLVNGGSYFTADEMWNMDDSNAWHSFLKEYSSGSSQTNFIQYSLNAAITNDTYASVYTASLNLRLSIAYDFTDDEVYTVGVDSLTSETTEVTIE